MTITVATSGPTGSTFLGLGSRRKRLDDLLLGQEARAASMQQG